MPRPLFKGEAVVVKGPRPFDSQTQILDPGRGHTVAMAKRVYLAQQLVLAYIQLHILRIITELIDAVSMLTNQRSCYIQTTCSRSNDCRRYFELFIYFVLFVAKKNWQILVFVVKVIHFEDVSFSGCCNKSGALTSW